MKIVLGALVVWNVRDLKNINYIFEFFYNKILYILIINQGVLIRGDQNSILGSAVPRETEFIFSFLKIKVSVNETIFRKMLWQRAARTLTQSIRSL